MAINKIEKMISSSIHTLIWRKHAQQEAEKDQISESKLEDSLRNKFKIIENYPDDPYGESVLVLTDVNNTPVHVVLSPRENLCYLITIYLPTTDKWNKTFTRRLKNGKNIM